jgi:hypothetical protein
MSDWDRRPQNCLLFSLIIKLLILIGTCTFKQNYSLHILHCHLPFTMKTLSLAANYGLEIRKPEPNTHDVKSTLPLRLRCQRNT